ncbi:TPR-like protein [Rickenella mellea]|uniref:TPR-like protein n=1 Tax=Rickenella mellea TaxID=50990 RepID=A0A4Y7QDY4_9AGAM|nr:TPR-like protein [Rickenella mellea]
MLINNAECGPVNPLQGLAKRFDSDRGIQQDHIGSSRAGSSREIFRTPLAAQPGLEQEAARFFAASPQPGLSLRAPSSFDLAAIRGSIPSSQTNSPSPAQQQQHRPHSQPSSSWAADFLQQKKPAVQAPHTAISTKGEVLQFLDRQNSKSYPSLSPSQLSIGPQWAPNFGPVQSAPQWMPQNTSQRQSVLPTSSQWDQEFQTQEASLSHVSSQAESYSTQETQMRQSVDLDDLARTAGLLVETVKDEQNPKFKNSKFLGLMRQIRDGVVVVEGNDMVERSADQTFSVDVKGKGKAETLSVRTMNQLPEQSMRISSTGYETSMHYDASADISRLMKKVHFDQANVIDETKDIQDTEDPNEEYFRQDNEDYIQYWNASAEQQVHGTSSVNEQAREWGSLQQSWDSFEATATGIKPISNYPFQQHNPYLLGSSSRTHNHAMHTTSQSFYESVLELEAEVQRDPTNARAWFDLGVKQQENEREAKAVVALQRALDLDDTHLPSWLAIAISHTNENNRIAADEAIEQWVNRYDRYKDVVDRLRRTGLGGGSQTHDRKHADLIEILMAMARSSPNGEVDADVQIALAVLLNTSEDYEKAQDCFRTALAVRPDDWQLYNRVGATLANSGSAEEALQFYYRALELNPAYIRARFNLGISCINMKRFEEAAQHILDALVLQDSDGAIYGPNDDKRGITSSALWESLKTTCLHLQRIDLASFCDRHDLDGFRREFNV